MTTSQTFKPASQDEADVLYGDAYATTEAARVAMEAAREAFEAALRDMASTGRLVERAGYLARTTCVECGQYDCRNPDCDYDLTSDDDEVDTCEDWCGLAVSHQGGCQQ